MKAGLNAVPQLSTLDGWWQEGFAGQNGWAVPLAQPGEDPDAADGARLYSLLEDQIIPLFYQRDAEGLPTGWLSRMKQSLRIAGSRFTARRMVQQYVRDYYVPAAHGLAPGDDPPFA
jgi:starch phosphorylase